MTPDEVRIAFEGAAQQRKDWQELGLFIAWHMAAFSRAKRLPKWDAIQKTIRRKPAQQMTAQDIKAFFTGIKDVTPPPLTEKERKTMARRQKANQR